MILRWILLFFGFFLKVGFCDQSIIFKALPSNVALTGSYLKLSCYIEQKHLHLFWSQNGKEIGEECKFYDKYHNFKCNINKNVYELFIESVQSEHGGNWSCAHGSKNRKNLNIEVIVKANIYLPKLLLVPTNKNTMLPNRNIILTNTASLGQLNAQSNLDLIPSGTGTYDNPIDLTNEKLYANQMIFVQCTTTCASYVEGIKWRVQNLTWTHNFRITSNTDQYDDLFRTSNLHELDPKCNNGLEFKQNRLQIQCYQDKSSHNSQIVKSLFFHTLVGLNRITCYPYYNKTMENYFQNSIQYQNERLSHQTYETGVGLVQNIWTTNHQADCSVGFTQTASCLYVLCPGRVTTWFTLGEKIALSFSIVLFLFLILIFCYLTRQRRRAKQKAILISEQQPQQHEIELML